MCSVTRVSGARLEAASPKAFALEAADSWVHIQLVFFHMIAEEPKCYLLNYNEINGTFPLRRVIYLTVGFRVMIGHRHYNNTYILFITGKNGYKMTKIANITYYKRS